MDSLLTTTESPVLQTLTQAAASHMLKSGQIQHHHTDTAYCRSKKYIMYVCQAAGMSQTFAIGCCNFQDNQHASCSDQLQQSQHHQSRSLRNPHADRYAADQLYLLCYLSMSDAGGLTLLKAALEQGNNLARRAFGVLQRLLAKDMLPTELTAANEALLARMQGLRRCSALLCPLLSQEMALQAQR